MEDRKKILKIEFSIPMIVFLYIYLDHQLFCWVFYYLKSTAFLSLIIFIYLEEFSFSFIIIQKGLWIEKVVNTLSEI